MPDMTRPPLRRLLDDEGSVLQTMLGPLERRVLEVVWSGETPSTVAQVQERMDGALAYTTVMTTMDRLFKKGLLDRRREGRAYVYFPRLSEQELEQDVVTTLIARLLARP